MSSPPLSSAVPERAGWFADRSLAAKFGILIGVVVLAFGPFLVSPLIGNANVREANEELDHVSRAEQLVLQLDTRASELEVDGFKALVRAVPADQAASGSTQIAENITGVSGAADSTTEALGQTRIAVDELSRMAADLRTTVGRFTY